MTDTHDRGLESLDTPALLLDRARVEANTRRMRTHLGGFGVTLRPHMKTAKCVEVAALAAGPGGPITVSTLHEAEWFAARGFGDILYAVGIVAGKLGRVAALRHDGVRMTVVTDDLATAHAIGAHHFEPDLAKPLRVLVEIDTGGRRAGLRPDDDTVLDIARVLHRASQVEFAGLMTHAGHSYHCHDLDAVRAVAAEERDGIVAAAERVRAAGLPCETVSVGSTPTAVHAVHLEGVTEMRPGVYVFGDLFQQAVGSCARDDIALSVLATVIGHNRHAGQLLLDAGALALSKDTGAAEHRPGIGYGEVCDARTLEWLGVCVADVHQEHGLVPMPDESLYTRLPVGTRVRVLPNHACMTAAAYSHYEVLDGERVVARWERTGGW